MLSSLRKRLTFSNVIALLALFIALGGSAYAVKRINGKSLVANSVTGKKLKKDTLTGREVDEAKLGVVPAAGDASTLDGKSAADFQGSGVIFSSGQVRLQVGEERTLLTKGPFTIGARCADHGGGIVNGQVFARTTEAGSVLGGSELAPGVDRVLVEISSSGKSYAPLSDALLNSPGGTALDVSSGIVYVGFFGVPCVATVKAIG